MSSRTSIEWAANADGTPGATWNPIRALYRLDGIDHEPTTHKVGFHCVHVSEGCRNCYAERLNMSPRFPGHGTGLPYAKQSEAKVRVFLDEERLAIPLRRRKPATYFLSSMTDVFADFVTDDMLDRLFAVMALSPQHTFIVLTKRADRMRAYLTPFATGTRWLNAMREIAPPPAGQGVGLSTKNGALRNVWLVVSVEDQANADTRIPDLLATPAAVRGVSCEPLLGPVDLTRMWLPMPGGGQSLTNVLRSGCEGTHRHNGDSAGHDHGEGTSRYVGDPRFPHHHHDEGCKTPRLDWVICGGESGPKARPMHPAWARSLRDQCAAAGVPFFFKQWGEHAVVYDRDKDDPDWRRCDVVHREHPRGQWLNLAGGQGFHGERVVLAVPVGKARAGRLLDGIEHNARPALHEVEGRKGEALATRSTSPGRPE